MGGSTGSFEISGKFSSEERAVLFQGDNLDLLQTIPDNAIQLVVTSPPYNVGKEYEKVVKLADYLVAQKRVIDECARVLSANGSICWQVGNHVSGSGTIVPLDIAIYPVFEALGLVLRNRIVWHFGHGLHAKRRFSGRYETVLWFTRSTNDYYFDLDAVRVRQKYPGKRHYKGARRGEYSGHPIGKNPSDFWEMESSEDPTDSWDIPNIKANHVEKTDHPCQYPIALVQRLIRALTSEDSWVLDPYLGSGTSACAAILERRRAVGAEIDEGYCEIARRRMKMAAEGALRLRPLDKPVYTPIPGTPLTTRPSGG